MKKTGLAKWIKPLTLAFCAGAIVIGPLDFFHTWTGVETYLDASGTMTTARWPWYVPLQMGFIGMAVLVSWTLFRVYVVDRLLGSEPPHRIPDRIVIPLSMVMIAVAYFCQPLSLAWKTSRRLLYPVHDLARVRDTLHVRPPGRRICYRWLCRHARGNDVTLPFH